MIRFSALETITNGKRLACCEDLAIEILSVDSRKTPRHERVLFFAIRGERHDGHEYLQELYAMGIRQFVVEYEHPAVQLLEDCNVLLVPHAIRALQQIARHHRLQFSLPVLAITGSNGKTIIKEWLYQLLSPDKVVVKNPGSYNSQLGVPLSAWQIQSYHQFGIFEAGISKPGEMENLAAVLEPTLGLFTNIGSAHDEGFSSRREKAEEKARLFTGVETLLYCKDHTLIDEVISAQKRPVFTWGFSPFADVMITDANDEHYSLSFRGRSFQLTLPFSDKASVENCFHCIAFLLFSGYSFEVIQSRIQALRAVPMRLELKEGTNHCLIIDDTYNNDLAGLEISLQFLKHQQQRKNKTLILSDILESGLAPETLMAAVAERVNTLQLHMFIGIGRTICQYRHLFGQNSRFYNNTDDFLNDIDLPRFQEEVILVKGARTFEFEKIVRRLQRKVHGTVMEIDLGAVVHNLNYFKSLLKPSTRLMVMVKAFAYGSGSNEIANLLQYHKVDYLGVAYADEGVELRKNNIALPIMVMNPSEESFDQLLMYNLEPEIYSFHVLHKLLKFLRGRTCVIHLKLDTGMHRLGFEEHELTGLVEVLKSNPHLHVASIFSHLAGADEAIHDAFSNDQGERFQTWADSIAAALAYKPLYHILNSPGILRLPHLQFDMVRLGIGLYGVDPTPDGFSALKPVATVKTIISQIKRIPKGETIGYGRRGVAQHDLVLGTIAIGYADGFSRAFSRGVGEVLVNGKRAPVVGNVCMDMTMINLTGTEAREGDEVIIFGKDLPIQEIASRINTIPYEILTQTSERVKRVFIAESI